MIDLNVSLLSFDIELVSHYWCSTTSGRLRPACIDVVFLEVPVKSERDVTLANIFAVLDCINLALMNLAKVMRMKLSLGAALIFHGCAPK